MEDASEFLSALRGDDPESAERLLPLVYDELRRLASRALAGERPGHTLQPTALVHEAYVRLIGGSETPRYEDYAQFFRAAATAMRRVLIDHARRKTARKRSAEGLREVLDDVAAPERAEELLALDLALEKLAEREPMHARLVELRYFGGLTGDQAARVLGVGTTTVDRHWAYARAWLQAELRP